MTALAKGKYADADHVETATTMFDVVGRTVVVDEKHMDAATTPAGRTVDGIMELEEGKLRVTLMKAVVKAAHHAKELALAGH